MSTTPRRRAVENRWIGHGGSSGSDGGGGGIDSTGSVRGHRHCRLNHARLCRPPASASVVAASTHAPADCARFILYTEYYTLWSPIGPLPNAAALPRSTRLFAHHQLRRFLPSDVLVLRPRIRYYVYMLPVVLVAAQTHANRRQGDNDCRCRHTAIVDGRAMAEPWLVSRCFPFSFPGTAHAPPPPPPTVYSCHVLALLYSTSLVVCRQCVRLFFYLRAHRTRPATSTCARKLNTPLTLEDVIHTNARTRAQTRTHAHTHTRARARSRLHVHNIHDVHSPHTHFKLLFRRRLFSFWVWNCWNHI